ncbi:uncharacterized protein [Hyperolius riggenbachi]|uniref:uncharacterized protein n=1 Tax=Hyperolius riggenbachi TaxID=752182 RepID=UPI0035A3AF37
MVRRMSSSRVITLRRTPALHRKSHGKPPSIFSVNQPIETTAQKVDPVTLNCSYTIHYPYIESEVVRLSVYWRVGNITGPYAYHPHQEMVHPNYKERATITGTSDLFIEGVQMADSTSFYCFVVIKLCTDDGHVDFIQYGAGTKLRIQDFTAPPMRSLMFPGEEILTLYVACKSLILTIVAALLVCYDQRTTKARITTQSG